MKRDIVVNLALKLIGIPYLWAGGTPAGWDCSGFVIWIYQVPGVLPSGDWTAEGLSQRWAKTDLPQRGDLAFYGQADPEAVTHVMMHLDDKQSMVIGESGGDHTCTTIDIAKLKGACVKVKPLKYRTDYLFSVGVATLDGL